MTGAEQVKYIGHGGLTTCAVHETNKEVGRAP